MANAACRDLVDEAKNYLLLQLPTRGRPSMQGPRTRPRKSLKLGEVLYVVGGYHNGKVFGSVECLAPEGANTEWKRAPPMSRGRFDPAANRWSGELVRPSSSRAAYALAALDSSLYAVGGVDDEDSVNVVERYDIERQVWTRVAPMNSCRSEHSVSTLNGCLYAIGGTDNESDLKSMERFDPRVGKWEVVCPMSTRRTSLGSAVLDGELYAVGGRGERRGLNLVEKYDPRTDKWTTIVGMKKRRYGAGVAVANGKLYAVGGSDDTTDLDTVEIFDVETNLWNYHSRINDGSSSLGMVVFPGVANLVFKKIKLSRGFICDGQHTRAKKLTCWTLCFVVDFNVERRCAGSGL
ncbi:kelch repeat protein, partial [Teladorsagia circumcincta]